MTNTEKIMKIVSLAMEINGECYDAESKKPFVSISLSPHVNSIHADFYNSGYESGAVNFDAYSSYYGGSLFGIEIGNSITLDKMISKMQELADKINPPEQREQIVEV